MAGSDDAMKWAQSNPNDPRAKAVMAKAWAQNNPTDPRSDQILQKIGAKAAQANNPQTAPDAADKAAQGDSPNAQPVTLKDQAYRLADQAAKKILPSGAYDSLKNVAMGAESAATGVGQGMSLGNAGPNSQISQQAVQEHPGLNTAGRVAGGVAAGSMLPIMSGGAAGTAMGRVAQNTGLAALQGYLTKPGQGGSRTANAVSGGLTGGAVSGALEGAASGGSGLADWLQQKAMGMKKYQSGVGTTAIQEGVRGTKGAMEDQVSQAIDRAGSRAGENIAGLGRIDSSDAAKPLQEYASGLKIGDIVPEHSAADYTNATNRGQAVASRGPVDATDAWSLSRAAGQAGYRNQKAMQSEGAYLAQLEQQGYSNAIKAAAEKANPGGTNDVAEDFSRMSDLYKAQHALSQDPTIRKGLPLTDLVAGGAGMASAGSLGGAAGVALAQALKSPALQSYGAKGLDSLGGAAAAAADPSSLQGLFGGTVAATRNPK